MRTVKLKSGGHVLVFDTRAEFVDDEVCFTEEELMWVLKMAPDHRDPETQRSFWETLIELKKTIPGYNFLEAFPKEAPREELAKSENVNARYARETLEILRGRRPKVGT